MTTTPEAERAGCCTTGAEAITGALEEIRTEEIPADVAAIRSAGFNLLLETGQPVTVDDLIETTDVSPERTTEIFESIRARGRVEFDDVGRLIGIAGLSLAPSRHQLTIGEDTRWTWCALDAVGILGALGKTGRVTSSDPGTGEAITIEFVDGRPAADVQLFILGGFADANVREDWCPRVNFFSDRASAERWVAEQGLEGDIVSVEHVAENAAAMWALVVDDAAPQVC